MDRCSAERIVRTCHQPVNLQRPERSVPRVSDSNADDLDRSAASLHVLKPRHCKPAFDEVSDHVAVEPMNEHKQLICGALRIAGEQLQRLALVGTKAMFRHQRQLILTGIAAHHSPLPLVLLITLDERGFRLVQRIRHSAIRRGR